MKPDKYNSLLERARILCSRSEKCSSDILKKLEEWGMENESDRNRAISVLREEKFIDDARYARFYVTDKLRFNRWGKAKLRIMLRGKGIPEDIISGSLESIESDDYNTLIRNELKRKMRSTRAKNRFDMKGKLFRFAASRGYDYDMVYAIIDEIVNEPDNPAT